MRAITAADRPRASTNGDPENCVFGVEIKNIATSEMINCKVFDSPCGFRIYNTINCIVRDCNVDRVSPVTPASANDFYVAFLVGGYVQAFGLSTPGNPSNLIGANGSLYLIHPTSFLQAPYGNAFVASTVVKLYGFIADTFIHDLEAANFACGIVVDGSGASGTTINAEIVSGGQPARDPEMHQDVEIRHPVLDGIGNTGIRVRNLNSRAAVEITDPYAFTGLTANACIDISSAPRRRGRDAWRQPCRSLRRRRRADHRKRREPASKVRNNGAGITTTPFGAGSSNVLIGATG